MSKKPKRSRHRIPDCALQPKADPVSDRYQAEVDASITRLEQRYRNAQQALTKAQHKAETARAAIEEARTKAAQRRAQRDYDKLLLIVEERRHELHQIELLMIPGTYSGRDSRLRHMRYETGAITIPLGATTGQKYKPQQIPMFPVETRYT